MNQFVYFAGSPLGGRVKVGVSNSPFVRLRSLQMSSPVDLELLAVYRGDAQDEYRFHSRYREHHAYGEWFDRCDLIENDIAAIASGEFDPTCLPNDCAFKGTWWLPKAEMDKLRARDAALFASPNASDPRSIPESEATKAEKAKDSAA